MKKIISAILCIIIMSATTTVAMVDSDFPDVRSDYWAYDMIQELTDLGIVDGYSDGKFHPQDTLTIEQFVKMVVLITESDVPPAKEGERWSMPYLEVAKEKGIIESTEDFNGFSWNAEITREQMASMVMSASGEEPEIDRVGEHILDNETIEDAYKDDVYGAYTLGIITGYADGKFYPKKSLSRAEGATVIMRLHSSEKRIPNGNVGVSNPTIEELMSNEKYKSEDYDFQITNNGYVTYHNGIFMSEDQERRLTQKQSQKFARLIENLYPSLIGRDSLILASSSLSESVSVYLSQSMYVDNFFVSFDWEKKNSFTITMDSLDNLSEDIPLLYLPNGRPYSEGKLKQLRIICDVMFEEESNYMYEKMKYYFTTSDEVLSHMYNPEIVTWKTYNVTLNVVHSGFEFTYEW